ncbi:MAG: type II toxin-antitoxin system HicB family antitoxin [Candidatus Yonathbacteria bacterium]|nr:type II toxin-antitoxin system HicB family antitoxin [Candidatus Yonathbacteria bacterium]
MINQFIDQNLKRAKYKILKDGTYYADVPRLRGVWANAKNLEDCRQELREVIEGWLLAKVHSHESVPGFSFKFSPRTLKHA